MTRTHTYDTVIIGSGLGGLVCGAVLSKEGQRVCVLEKNEQIGGNLQTFKRDGKTFDTGVHYVGGLDKGQNLYKYFNYLGIMDRLHMERLDENGFDVVAFKDSERVYKLGMGYTKFKEVLLSDFPTEEAAIDKYCADIQKLSKSYPMYYVSAAEQYDSNDLMNMGAEEYLIALTENKKLRTVLAGNMFIYAGVSGKTPLYVHALIENSYIESAYRFIDGGDQIAQQLSRVIKNNGGEILRKHEVTTLVEEGDTINYAEDIEGRKYYADNFISNIHPVQTMALTNSKLIRNAYRNRLQGLENSISVFAIYISLKEHSLLYEKSNFNYFAEPDAWKGVEYTEESWPYMYAMYPAAMNADSKYADTISIMCFMRSDEVKTWADTHNTTLKKNERGETYGQFKKRKAEKLLDVVEEKFPDFRKHIETYYTATPLTFRDYIGSDDGTLYGIVKDHKDIARTYISPRTKISNLFLTGQNINIHGVLGVTVSAFLTCSMMIDKKTLIDKVNDANKN